MSTPAWVYLLRCADGSLYTGWTVDVERRLQAHRNGASRYTRARLPIELAASFPMESARAARREEARIKRLSRPQKQALIKSASGADTSVQGAGRVFPGARSSLPAFDSGLHDVRIGSRETDLRTHHGHGRAGDRAGQERLGRFGGGSLVGADGTIHGCAPRKGGTLKLVRPSKGCPKHTVAVTPSSAVGRARPARTGRRVETGRPAWRAQSARPSAPRAGGKSADAGRRVHRRRSRSPRRRRARCT